MLHWLCSFEIFNLNGHNCKQRSKNVNVGKNLIRYDGIFVNFIPVVHKCVEVCYGFDRLNFAAFLSFYSCLSHWWYAQCSVPRNSCGVPLIGVNNKRTGNWTFGRYIVLTKLNWFSGYSEVIHLKCRIFRSLSIALLAIILTADKKNLEEENKAKWIFNIFEGSGWKFWLKSYNCDHSKTPAQ